MIQRAITFRTIFPGYRDFHFFKDPGQIPYRISRAGYDSAIVCFDRGEDFSNTEKHLKIIKVRKRFLAQRSTLAIVMYLLGNSSRIDILNVFHLSWSSLLFIFIYKTLNRSGFAYLKLDDCAFAEHDHGDIDFTGNDSDKPGKKGLKVRLKNYLARKYFVHKADLWSIEDDYSNKQFQDKYPFMRGKMITVLNGHTSDLPGSVDIGRYEDKEDIILTAGRIGTFQKATEILLEAFKMIADKIKFNLHLAGTVEPAFKSYIKNYRLLNPSLDERVIFHGSLERDELYRLYSRSKVFCLPSRFEGMALVFPESMFYKNAIVTTRDVSLKCLVDRYGFGILVNKENAGELSEALSDLVNDSEKMENMGHLAHEVATDLLNWDIIIKSLLSEIEHRQSHGKL
jgi:glycosyltransferase involved in cell wall biosynthesis